VAAAWHVGRGGAALQGAARSVGYSNFA
jgi:hypothetical protein